MLPSLERLVGLELGQRRAGDDHERRVAVVQHRQVAQGVHIPRAARAALVPRRVEHEVVDDELAAAVEEVSQAPCTVRAVEGIVLLDLDHGEPAPLGIHPVAVLGELLLVAQKLLALGEPFVPRHDPRHRHVGLYLCHVQLPSLRRAQPPRRDASGAPGLARGAYGRHRVRRPSHPVRELPFEATGSGNRRRDRSSAGARRRSGKCSGRP